MAKASNLDAIRMKKSLLSNQHVLKVQARDSNFTRTTRILKLAGVMMICRNLLRIPNDAAGSPTPLNHEIFLYPILAASEMGIILNLSVFLMHFLSRVNEKKLEKMEPDPSVEVIHRCYTNQRVLVRTLRLVEKCIFIIRSSFRVYVLMIGLLATFAPNNADVLQTASTVWSCLVAFYRFLSKSI